MNVNEARLLLPQFQQLLAQLELALTPDLPPPPIFTNQVDLDIAIRTADPGATLLLSPSLVYPSHLVLTKPVRLIGAGGIPTFLDGIDVKGDNTSLDGLLIKRVNPLIDIMQVTGTSCTINNCTILGDPVKGAKRGVAANGANFTLTNSLIDHCFATYPGADSQAVIIWDNPGPILIEGNKLYAGSETILIGGADPSSLANIPSDITIRGNIISARPEWQSQLIGVKSRFEVKNGRRILLENNDISYCWGGHGQDGYLVSLTVRNQGNTAPYSTIEDVTIRNNRLSSGAGLLNLLATDNIHPSQQMRGITFTDNLVNDIDPKKYTGRNQLFLLGAGPHEVTIERNVIAGLNIGSQVYFYGKVKSKNLSIVGNTWPKSKYGVFGDNTASAAVMATFVESGTISGNTEI